MTRHFCISASPRRRPVADVLLAELHHARAQVRRRRPLSLLEAAHWAGGLATALRESERAAMGARR